MEKVPQRGISATKLTEKKVDEVLLETAFAVKSINSIRLEGVVRFGVTWDGYDPKEGWSAQLSSYRELCAIGAAFNPVVRILLRSIRYGIWFEEGKEFVFANPIFVNERNALQQAVNQAHADK